jgi:hypothetical protein
MNSDKTLYWVALIVIALGLSQQYRDGKYPAAHSAVTNVENTLCRLATRAEHTFAMARFIVNPPEASPDALASAGDFTQAQAELLRDQALGQAELVREQVQAQAEMLRARAEIRRAEIEQMRQFNRTQLHLSRAANRKVTLVCPVTGQRVSVRMDPETIEVGDNF